MEIHHDRSYNAESRYLVDRQAIASPAAHATDALQSAIKTATVTGATPEPFLILQDHPRGTDRRSAVRQPTYNLAGLLACLPVNVYLLREGDGGIVVGDLAEGRRVTARQRDAVVHIEDAGGAARGPNDGGGGDYESWPVSKKKKK